MDPCDCSEFPLSEEGSKPAKLRIASEYDVYICKQERTHTTQTKFTRGSTSFGESQRVGEENEDMCDLFPYRYRSHGLNSIEAINHQRRI